jgi:hypothetical protein
MSSLIGVGLATALLLLVAAGPAAVVLLACRRYGAQRLLAPTVLGSLCIALLSDPSLGVAPLVGLIAGFQVERQQSYGRIIGWVALPGALQALLFLIGQGGVPREELIEQFLGQLDGLDWQSVEDGDALREVVVYWVHLWVRLLPGFMFVFTLFTALLAYRLSRIAADRLRVALPEALPLRLWRPWTQLIWVLIGGLALKLASSGTTEDLGLNLILVMAIIYAVQGMAVGRFYAHRLGVSPLLELVFYLALFTSGVGMFLLPALGLMDTWFDWRRLEVASDQTPTEGGEKE